MFAAAKAHLAENLSRTNDPRAFTLFSSFRKRSVATPEHAMQQQRVLFMDPSPSSFLPSGPPRVSPFLSVVSLRILLEHHHINRTNVLTIFRPHSAIRHPDSHLSTTDAM
ncbi:hypothetical protein BU15DRAFT_75512 [Melanogaster broomeanus]|nr:hypothetical protein BU15DRAFT_75512 [Melanogaster broomeanus]